MGFFGHIFCFSIMIEHLKEDSSWVHILWVVICGYIKNIDIFFISIWSLDLVENYKISCTIFRLSNFNLSKHFHRDFAQNYIPLTVIYRFVQIYIKFPFTSYRLKLLLTTVAHSWAISHISYISRILELLFRWLSLIFCE